MTAPIPFEEWKARRDFDAWKASKAGSEPERSGFSNFARGVALGGAESLTSLGEVAGMIPGLGGVGRGAEAARQGLEDQLAPQGFSGKAGRFIGRAGGEIGQAVLGAPLIAKGIAKVAPRVGKALQAGMQSGSRLTRAGAVAAANAPIDVLQGAKADEGILLPGRLGSIAENVGFSGVAGAVLPAMKGARQVESPAPPKDTGFPERTTPLGDPNINPDDYANINRMTANEPQLADDFRESVADAVKTRELPERLPPRGKEKLGRLKEARTEADFRAQVAELYGVRPSDIVARTAAGERVGGEAIFKATEEAMETRQRINALNARLRSGMVMEPAEAAKLTAMKEVETNKMRDLLASVTTQKTQAARDLQSLRFGASLSDDPVVWKDNLEEMAKRALTADEVAQVERLAEIGDIQGLTRLGNEVRKSSLPEKVWTFFKANLLSGPATHIVNFTGNAGMAALRQASNVPATWADMAMASLTGRRTKVWDAGGKVRSLVRGSAEGRDEARAVMRGELPTSSKFKEMRETNYDNAWLNLYTKGVFRALDAGDRFWKGGVLADSIDEQLRAIAMNRGLKGKAAEDFVSRMTAAPTLEVGAEAILAAEKATFQQTTQLSKAAVKLRDSLPFGVGNVLFPFAKTPANIAGTIVHHTPLGLLGKDFVRNAKKVAKNLATTAEQRMVAERIGEVSVGSVVLLTGYFMAKRDLLTGFYPADERTRAQWESERRSEGSVRVGNQWVQISRLSPLGNLLTIGAAMSDLEKGDENVLGMAIGSVAAPLSAVTDLPMVQGVSNLAELFSKGTSTEQKESAFRRMAGGSVSGFIPASGLLRGVARASDPMVRETREEGALAQMGNQVLGGIPAASRLLPAKVDPLGEQMRRGGTAFERFASPFPRQQDMTARDPLRAALHQGDAVVGRVARRKGETPEAYQQRAMRTGEVVRTILERAVESPSIRAVDTMNVERIQRQLEAAGVDVEDKTDEELRAALRTQMLERVIARGKSIAAKEFRQPVPARARALGRILDRQP